MGNLRLVFVRSDSRNCILSFDLLNMRLLLSSYFQKGIVLSTFNRENHIDSLISH
jgi:hypothetical protein